MYMDVEFMKVLVTGADGSLAQSLIPILYKKKHSLSLIGKDIVLMKQLYGVSTNIHSYLNLEQFELRNIIESFQPDILIHLSAYSTASDEFDDMIKLFSANLLFLGKILDALKNVNLKLFIYTGSSTEYAKGDDTINPAYLYSATKTAGRTILKYYSEIYNFKNISINPYSIYGGTDTRKKVLDLIYDSLNSAIPINLTQGNQVLDFIHVDDIAKLYISVIERFASISNNSILQAGTGVGHSLKKIAALIETISGKKANINWGGVDYRKKDIMFSVADILMTKRACCWEPSINIYEGLRRLLKEKSNK